jgi:hypothetical protein
MGLQNYVVIMPIKNSCIKFNNKINSLQNHDIAQNYRILHKVVQRLFQHNLKISKNSCIQKIYKNDLNKMCRYVHGVSL